MVGRLVTPDCGLDAYSSSEIAEEISLRAVLGLPAIVFYFVLDNPKRVTGVLLEAHDLGVGRVGYTAVMVAMWLKVLD